MAILNVPVWPFEPNWSSSVTEVLEWLTDILVSPTGSEQRRSLRYFPRRTFEYSTIAADDERTLLDNLLVSFGAQRWYLPIWHDVSFIETAVSASATFIPSVSASDGKLLVGGIAYLVNDSVYDYELVEIEDVTSIGVVTSSPLAHAWPKGTRIYPVSLAKFTDQPEVSKLSDRLVTAQVRFQVVEPTVDPNPSAVLDDIDSAAIDTYRGFFVVNLEPDERRSLTAGYERLMLELDNKRSIPRWTDTAARPFTYQQYAWALTGRAEHAQFELLLQVLRGRATPIWIPTFMSDLQLVLPISDGATTVTVQRCGFTQTGGPRPDRQDIMMDLGGERIYRRVTNSAQDSSGREILVLDSPINRAVALTDPIRICFMTIMRLNHDAIQIEHSTDNTGYSSALLTFRSAPDTRQPITAVYQ